MDLRRSEPAATEMRKMRTFGGFISGHRFFYGEIRGDEVRVLKNPFWIDIEPTAEIVRLTNVVVDLPVAPSKLIAVGLNYSDHIAEMKRTPLGTPLIWFKSPGSLLPHDGTIEIAFPEHQTDFEAEMAIVIGRDPKKFLPERAPCFAFGFATSVGPIYAGDELEATIDGWPRLRNTVAIASQARSTGEK